MHIQYTYATDIDDLSLFFREVTEGQSRVWSRVNTGSSVSRDQLRGLCSEGSYPTHTKEVPM